LGQYLTAPSPQGYPEANLRWYIDNVSNK